MRVHFIGISGIGMSAAALLAKDSGYQVTGSADTENDRIDVLKKHGIEVFIGHRASNLRNPDLTVFTNAVHPENEEFRAALQRAIPLLPRLVFLGKLLMQYPREIIGVTGTDGKSTTTAMVAHILKSTGADPTVLLGGLHDSLEMGNYRYGKGPLVMEVDESDGYLRSFQTHLACFTNIHGDHLEHYEKDFNLYRDAILEFLFRAKERVFPESYISVVSDYRACHPNRDGNDYTFHLDQAIATQFYDLIPGLHNRSNACCAIKVCGIFGVSSKDSQRSLETFHFVDRRFSIRYDSARYTIIDDYAHTSREITSVLQAVQEKYPGIKPYLVFEAHRYSRLERESDNFISAFRSAELQNIFVLPIYSAYEEKKPELFDHFLSSLTSEVPLALYCREAEDIVRQMPKNPEKKAILLFVGAGNSSTISKKVALLFGEMEKQK